MKSLRNHSTFCDDESHAVYYPYKDHRDKQNAIPTDFNKYQ